MVRDRTVFNGGFMSRYCAVCDVTSDAFLEYGIKPRADARCPACGSLERHRFLLVFLRTKTDFFDSTPKRFLHIAPEKSLGKIFASACGSGYLSADLNDPTAMEKMDITDIRHPDDSFDAIYCSHVLEHVPDDRKAMRELCRVLRPSGFAILNVPVLIKETFEDPSIVDPVDRQRVYGHFDHVRNYGRDYKDRLVESGFEVTECHAHDLLSPEEIERHGLRNRCCGEIYMGTKRQG